MVKFIANRIKKEKDNNSLEQAQDLYRAYFINITIYEKWHEDVDNILISDGYADCIVNE